MTSKLLPLAKLSKPRPNVSNSTALCIMLALAIHAVYITTISIISVGPATLVQFTPSFLASSRQPHLAYDDDIPPLFIYRRTKKSGSSSMLNELLASLVPLGYKPLYYTTGEMDIAVRNEYVKPHPGRLLVAEHNRITRAFHPQRRAVIADTVRDGYAQMTSFCRYVLKVKSCTDGVADCLRSGEALEQMRYRWAGRPEEDDDTYIDLPLSSAHPALSTTVMRTVYPNISLDVSTFNVRHTACPELPLLRDIYDELYGELDEQIVVLKQRILAVAGYPYFAHSKTRANMTVDHMLDAAEQMERKKYDLSEKKEMPSKRIGYSDLHLELRATIQAWMREGNGKMSLRARRH